MTQKIISLYSGAGGLDYGFEAAGCRTAVAVELDHDCCETLRTNRDFPVIERSIFDVPSEELLEVAGLRRGEVDLVIGGPPCQPFSKAGYWASGDSKRLADPRAGTLGAYMRVVEETLPRAFVLENVEGMAYSEKNEGLALVLGMVNEVNRRTGAGYSPSWKVLCTADYGVPQVRRRLFVVASFDGQNFKFPRPTHRPPEEPGDLPTWRTAWDALGDLEIEDPPKMRGKWADLLPSIPEGENYLWHTERGGGLPLFGWRRRYWSFLLKLSKARPSWTIQAQPGPSTGPFHWASRPLTMRELCRLQTFPDDVKILGSAREIQRQVGNAVPSLLAEVLGREIGRQILGHVVPHDLILMPPDRGAPPPPGAVAPAPQRFRSLAGEHEEHPGTGLGRRASSRWAR